MIVFWLAAVTGSFQPERQKEPQLHRFVQFRVLIRIFSGSSLHKEHLVYEKSRLTHRAGRGSGRRRQRTLLNFLSFHQVHPAYCKSLRWLI